MRWPWTKIASAIAAALGRTQEPPAPPREVRDALGHEYDPEAYRQAGGGVAPPDAPRIDDDRTI